MSRENKNQDRLLADLDKSPDVNKSRRLFAKSGIAAPVIVSLASKPVFGAQCLSNTLSINQSHPTSACWGGGGAGRQEPGKDRPVLEIQRNGNRPASIMEPKYMERMVKYGVTIKVVLK